MCLTGKVEIKIIDKVILECFTSVILGLRNYPSERSKLFYKWRQRQDITLRKFCNSKQNLSKFSTNSNLRRDWRSFNQQSNKSILDVLQNFKSHRLVKASKTEKKNCFILLVTFESHWPLKLTKKNKKPSWLKDNYFMTHYIIWKLNSPSNL